MEFSLTVSLLWVGAKEAGVGRDEHMDLGLGLSVAEPKRGGPNPHQKVYRAVRLEGVYRRLNVRTGSGGSGR